MTLYTDRKPREAVARAIAAARDYREWGTTEVAGVAYPAWHLYVVDAEAALTRLRELGFITSEGLDAIHAEEDANGEPRSWVALFHRSGDDRRLDTTAEDMA